MIVKSERTPLQINVEFVEINRPGTRPVLPPYSSIHSSYSRPVVDVVLALGAHS